MFKFKTIFKDTNLDLMFIMDLTGSMGMWLNEAKSSMSNIIEEITDNNPGAKIRISFMGYRDYTEPNEKRIYYSKEFTENISDFNIFLSKLDCYGGGDEPEDVIGALEEALKMNWESNAKYAVLVCDAPCHGKKYHNVTYDKFREGDPDGKCLEDIVKKFWEMGITFYCIEINDSTKIMFNIMKEIYNDDKKFHVEKLGYAVDQFSFFVAFSASVLLGNAKYAKCKFSDLIMNYRNEIIEQIVKKYQSKINIDNKNFSSNESITQQLINEIENLNLEGNDKKLFEFINRMSDLKINNDSSNNITIENNIINKYNDIIINFGNDFELMLTEEKEIDCTLRGLSYNKDTNSVNDWVCPNAIEKSIPTKLIFLANSLIKKENEYEISVYDKILDKKYLVKSSIKIEKQTYLNSNNYLKKICMDDLICEQIGDYFNIRLYEENQSIRQYIKFQKHILYELNIANMQNIFGNCKYFIGEFSVPFPDNLTCDVSELILNTFTHFSYQISGGQLIITNLKYDNITKKISEYKIETLKGCGYKRFLEFFSTHICNNTCKKLGLVHPRKKININVDETFFSGKNVANALLCKCCSLPIRKSDMLLCCICSCQEIRTKTKAVCSVCNTPFIYSSYINNCQLNPTPDKCEKCSPKF